MLCDQNKTELSIAAVESRLRAYHFHYANEDELQQGIAKAIRGFDFHREHPLRPHGRVDFYLPGLRLGIESKIKGPQVALMRQLHGYCLHGEVDGLILVTSKPRLAVMPEQLNGKPVIVVGLWGQSL